MFGLSPLPRTLRAALRDAQHKKQEVQLSAIRELGQLATGDGRLEACAVLLTALRSESFAVRAEAALALADARAREHLAELILLTEDKHPRVRQMALLALGELGDPGDSTTLAAVERHLQDERPGIRFQSLVALFRVSGERAEPHIIQGITDPDSEVRYISLRLAEEHWLGATIGRDERADSSLSESLPPVVTEAALLALRDDAAQVKLSAAILLSRSGNPAGDSIIVHALNASQKIRELDDEQASVELAGQRRLLDARPGLERRAWRGWGMARHPFAWHARVALARMGDPRAKAAIVRGLNSWMRDERTSAVAAAGQARLYEARELVLKMDGDERMADPQAVADALRTLARPAGENG